AATLQQSRYATQTSGPGRNASTRSVSRAEHDAEAVICSSVTPTNPMTCHSEDPAFWGLKNPEDPCVLNDAC
ncbi:MAG TPA: hypothetical protein VJ723_06615, partial [Candidatus Angelobacter sp.]|nr:hypothetical protein [Candidatus Angelobacter sp.]